MSKVIIVLFVLAVILGSVAFLVLVQAERSRSDLPVLATVGDFTLTDQYGQPFTDEDMRGKLSVVEFFFTSCRGPCPIMNGYYAELYRAYEGAEDVQFVSISVDPTVDTVAKLAEYAAGFGVDDRRWVFLTGPMDSIVHISENYFMLPADDLPGAHSTRFILVDRENNIRAFYSGIEEASVNVLRSHLQTLRQDKE